MKKNLKYIVLAIIIGIIIGCYIFNSYKEETQTVMSNKKEYVYLMQYGVYKSKYNMTKSASNLKNYFYYYDNELYHVIIGITKNKENKEKIMKAYDIDTKLYLKRIQIDNYEFLEALDQYDKLLSQTDDNRVILACEKQILSKYEELLNNE